MKASAFTVVCLAVLPLTGAASIGQSVDPAVRSLDGAVYRASVSGGTVPPSTMTNTYTINGDKIWDDFIWEDGSRVINTKHANYVIEGSHFFIAYSSAAECQRFYGTNTCGWTGTITPKAITFITVAGGRDVSYVPGIGGPRDAKRVKTRRK